MKKTMPTATMHVFNILFGFYYLSRKTKWTLKDDIIGKTFLLKSKN